MITVITQTSDETLQFQERKYQQFLTYYNTTDLKIDDIFRSIGLTNTRNSTVRHIRKRLREDGYNSLNRANMIKRGEWL